MNKAELRKANWQLKLFGWFKIPMIWYCRPRIAHLTGEKVEIRIKLRRKTKNHLNSMYFGALSVGADLASGFLAFHIFKQKNIKASLAFAGASSKFHKRAEGDVTFICNQGQIVSQMVKISEETGERITKPITVHCYALDEEVATFIMELSLKVKK